MKRLLLVLAIAAMMLALTASPVLAQADPTRPPSTDEDKLLESEANCVGAGSAEFGAGKGGNPGSFHEPSEEFDNFNGPATSEFVKGSGGTALGEFQPSSGHLDCGGAGGGQGSASQKPLP